MGRSRLLPENTGIETGYSISSVCMSFTYVHLPNDLCLICLSNLEHARRGDAGKRSRHIELNVAIRQLLDTSTPKRIKTRNVLPESRSGPGTFINLEDCGATVTR